MLRGPDEGLTWTLQTWGVHEQTLFHFLGMDRGSCQYLVKACPFEALVLAALEEDPTEAELWLVAKQHLLVWGQSSLFELEL